MLVGYFCIIYSDKPLALLMSALLCASTVFQYLLPDFSFPLTVCFQDSPQTCTLFICFLLFVLLLIIVVSSHGFHPFCVSSLMFTT